MSQVGSAIQNSRLKIPTYLPFVEAMKKLGVSRESLTQLIVNGKIGAIQLPSGELLVAASDGPYKTKKEIIDEEFADLRGKKISAREASRKYSKAFGIPISQPNFSRWAAAGYIEVIERAWKLQLNEADVAYCAKIYTQKYKEYQGQMSGVNVFDTDGNPYQLKYPEVAEQMRTERRSKKET